MQGFINTLLSAEADSVCGASDGARDPGRTNRRNGYRHRDLDTRIGTLVIAVPKLRECTYFPEGLLERRSRVRDPRAWTPRDQPSWSSRRPPVTPDDYRPRTWQGH